MQRMIKQWLILGLAVGVFASCSQEGNEPNSTTEVGGETVSFSLSAEVSVDDPSLRAIDYKLGNNANGELVPMPQFTDKQEVEVHTILKSSNGAVAAKTLKWRYSAASKKLVLSQNDGHSITVSGFNNDNGVKWYISGLIGGELIPNTTRVTFAGERVLKGVDGNEGDIVGSLNVPYAFGWTELTINTNGTREGNGSYKYAEVPKESSVKFVPRGSLIAYKLGNALTSGSYTFSANGFTVATNTWGDQGEFELGTHIPTTNPEKALPLWTESTCGSSIYYTFADGHTPGSIAHNGTADKTYYAWVIPHKEQPTKAEVRVMLKGESSRPETATYKDYTKTYFTDYAPKATGTQGRVTEGKIHKLTAKATNRVALPIEYVTEYNLAGGEGLTYITTNFTNPQPAGVQGPLRFADSHDNDQSGYYNWYTVMGHYDATYNPNIRNLNQSMLIDTDGSSITLGDKYTIPDAEHLRSIFPGGVWGRNWDFMPEDLDKQEVMRVGLGTDVIRLNYSSDYSRSFTFPHGGNDASDDAVFYAIRFKKAKTASCKPIVTNTDYNIDTNSVKYYEYPPAIDNAIKCAYRFVRIGGSADWRRSASGGQNLAHRVRIDVVYLGEESSPTTLSTISDESWWSAKSNEGVVLSRIFPIPGYNYNLYSGGEGVLRDRGAGGSYWSAGKNTQALVWAFGFSFTGVGSSPRNQNFALPVRLFSQPSR